MDQYWWLEVHAGAAHHRQHLVDVTGIAPAAVEELRAGGLKAVTEAVSAALQVNAVQGDVSTPDVVVRAFAGEHGLTASLRLCASNGYLGLDVSQQVVPGGPCLPVSVVTALGEKLKALSKGSTVFSFPPLIRGSSFNPYVPTADGLLIQYDYDKPLFHEQSPYQNVKIMSSRQFGAMLLLDDDPNLADSDIAYTKAITGDGTIDYKHKRVLILGGGDGGILNYLLQQEPGFVYMVDLDATVIEACKKYMRPTCGTSMDQLKGENYEIVVADCVPWLQEKAASGEKFDVVINDLTAIPVTPGKTASGDQWDFLRLILQLSMNVLKDEGRYFTQGNAANLTRALAMYESQLERLEKPIKFSKNVVTVPSYHEQWVFYEMWFV